MEVVLYIGIAQSIFAGIMLMLKKPIQISDKILAAWLFFIGFQMIFSILNRWVQITSFTFIPFVYGPLLFIYCETLMAEKPIFKKVYWFHFIPLIVFLILAFILRDPQVFNLDNFLGTDKYLAFRIVYSLFIAGSIITYSVVAFMSIGRHQKRIKDHYSFTNQKITLGWLKFVSISFCVFYILLFGVGIADVFTISKSINVYLFSYFVLTFYAYTFSIFGYQQARIFPEEPIVKRKKYERSGLKKEEADEHLDKLLKYMDRHKPYLNGNLTINDLAVDLKISRHYLTQILNSKLEKNFYTFINEYRVEVVKELLLNKKYDHYTFTAIGYDAGFNSKSSFHMVFKQFTGHTPSQFKEMHRND